MERLGQIEFKELPSFSLQQQGPRDPDNTLILSPSCLKTWEVDNKKLPGVWEKKGWAWWKIDCFCIQRSCRVTWSQDAKGYKDNSVFGLNSNNNYIWLFQNSVIIPLNKMNLFNAQACFPAPELCTTFMRINKLIWRHLPQAMRVKTFYLLFIFSWDCLTACRGGSLNYSYRVSHWDSSRRRGGREEQ